MAKQKLGKYEVQERLGRGGMAEVYRAYHSNLDRYVAIKVLHAFLAEDDEFRVRFEKEARNIAKLNHAHIVQVYDFDYAPERDSYYMVMELVEGETLKDRLYELADSDKKLPVREVLRIVREAASALAYAHSRGMIHRDVKPANLMIDLDDRIVLTDFGIAKMLDSKQLTVSGGMIGTPAYMSPEQGLGEAGDERSDIYSLGVIMYQLLVGDLPYDAETALGVILMHVNDPVPSVRKLDESISESVQDIVNLAMAKDPTERYQTADEMIEDIEEAEQEISSGEITQTRPPGQLQKQSAPTKPDARSGTAQPQEAPTQPDPLPLERPERKSDSKPAVPQANPRQTSPSPQARITSTTNRVATEDRLRRTQRRSGSSTNASGTPWAAIMTTLVVLVLLGGGYLGAAQQGMVPGFGLVGGGTPTPDLVAQQNATATAVAVIAAAATDTPTPTSTSTEVPPTATATATHTPTTVPPTATEEATPTPTISPTPSETPNVTQTVAAEQTATISACEFDYAIVDQVPDDGEPGGFFPVNEPYTREISLLNTGTCPWGENTSMTFVGGEDFDAGPRIFIRDSLAVGEEITVIFEGTTPDRGSLEPLVGTWQLRTRGQVSIGNPIDISILVFDPGA